LSSKEIPFVEGHEQAPAEVGWLLPGRDQIIVNFDAFIIQGLGTGLGLIARDSNGEVLAATTR